MNAWFWGAVTVMSAGLLYLLTIITERPDTWPGEPHEAQFCACGTFLLDDGLLAIHQGSRIHATNRCTPEEAADE